jgi:hypothetical protein
MHCIRLFLALVHTYHSKETGEQCTWLRQLLRLLSTCLQV